VQDLMGEVNKNLPNIQRFSRDLVEKFLAKLPSYVATAKRELPILIDKAAKFIESVATFGKDIAGFLGPDGLVTAGIGILGTKMGGLGGGIGAIFAEQFIKMGVDPITATLTGTIGGAITAGVVQGFGSAFAQAAITKFLGLFKSIPISPSIPTSVPGAAAIPGLAVGAAAVAVSIVAITTAAAAMLTNAITENGMTNKIGGNNVIDIFGTTAATLASKDDPMKVLGGLWEFITTGKRSEEITAGVVEGFKTAPPQAPINLSSATTLTLDGQVVANSVNRYLGLTASTSNGTRNGGR